MSAQAFTLNPIGTVKAGPDSFFLQIDEPFRPALLELDSFAYIHVLFWCHLLDDEESRKVVQCDKPYRKSPPKMGIFATRSPVRPNPIATTPVGILSIDHSQGLIAVPYIDAEDGSPILDIKPYHPAVDRIRDVSLPGWCSHWPGCYEDSATFDWESEFVNAQ